LDVVILFILEGFILIKIIKSIQRLRMLEVLGQAAYYSINFKVGKK